MNERIGTWAKNAHDSDTNTQIMPAVTATDNSEQINKNRRTSVFRERALKIDTNKAFY